MRRHSLSLTLAAALLAPVPAAAQTSPLAVLLSGPISDAALPDLVLASADGVMIAGRPVVSERKVLTLLPRRGAALGPVSAATPLAVMPMTAQPLPPVTGTALPLPALAPTARPLDPVAKAGPLAPVAPQALTPRLPDPTNPADRTLLEAILGPEGAEAAKPVLTGKALALAVQTELKRVNCYGGSLDGSFGRGSNGALDKFFADAKLQRATPDLTQAVLDQIIATAAPACDSAYVAPVAVAKPSKPSTAASGGGTRRTNTATTANTASSASAAPAAKPKPAKKEPDVVFTGN
jgi:hypothetical protein